MERCITAEQPFSHPTGRPKPFSPVPHSSPPGPKTPSPPPLRLHPLAQSSLPPHHVPPLRVPRPLTRLSPPPRTPSPALSPSPMSRPASSATVVTRESDNNSHHSQSQTPSLEFDLIVHDALGTSDNTLTHPWDLPSAPLRIGLDTTKAQLVNLLRAYLPSPRQDVITSNKSNSNTGFHLPATPKQQLPKLLAVTLYWTFRGDILPLGPDDAEWHYRNPITKTDLLGRSEAEWFLLREMMAASSGALKCYLAIRGETPDIPASSMAEAAAAQLPTTKSSSRLKYGRWFGYARKSRGAVNQE